MPDRWATQSLRNGDLELVMLPGIGGRLWDVVFQGQSLLFQNPDLVGHPIDDGDLSALPTRSPQFNFPLWGGEKTWIAPDTQWSNAAPFPTLDSGAYRVTTCSTTHIEMTSAVCPTSMLSVARQISLISPTQWRIDHVVTNQGAQPRRTGIWSVMMLNTPATLRLAADSAHPVFGDAGDRVIVEKEGLVVTCDQPQEFKIAMANPTGTTAITCGPAGPWIDCATEPPTRGDDFAHGHPFEVFNSGDYPYFEAEWHSPAVDLAPWDAMHFRQDFTIRPHDNRPDHTGSKELSSCTS